MRKHKKIKVNNLFIGRAGEYKVISELILNGYNANFLSIDTGIDILAEKEDENGENQVYKIQVKTTTQRISIFRFKKDKFKSLYQNIINLIIVFFFKELKYQPCCVLPPSIIYMLTSGIFKDKRAPIQTERDMIIIKLIAEINNNDCKIYIRNKNYDITPLINRFDVLESSQTDISHIPSYAGWSVNGGVKFEF